ncbi:MAG TPA: inositol phosphorylceramide synthase, partial [Acidimicrobiia bacterium]|nr:inositol phosphorylceramide synthase [Acidimicrobiia bacterium]
ATGNHYWLDGVVGIAVVAVAVVFERWARGVITCRLAARQPAGGGSGPGSDRLPRPGVTV